MPFYCTWIIYCIVDPLHNLCSSTWEAFICLHLLPPLPLPDTNFRGSNFLAGGLDVATLLLSFLSLSNPSFSNLDPTCQKVRKQTRLFLLFQSVMGYVSSKTGVNDLDCIFYCSIETIAIVEEAWKNWKA